LYLKKGINDWTDEEKEEYGNKEQLRKEKEQVWKKKEQLREQLQKEKEQENVENGTTIVRYVVETLPLHEFPASDSAAMKQLQERIHSFNGKEISFNSSKPNKWPGGQFLAFHNRCFYKKREVQKMKAQAKPQELNEEGFGQSSAEHSETTRKVKRWLAAIDDTDLPSFIE
ncbi:hypothetical protein HDV02_006537, partial [Globomyces sp. JEL0801]